MKSILFTVLVSFLFMAGTLTAQSESDNVTFDDFDADMEFAAASPKSTNYMVNATIKEFNVNEAFRHPITGVNIEVFNKTTQKLELNVKKHPQSRFSFYFKHGNEYIIMLRKKGFMVKRVTAKIGVDGCIACYEGMYTLTPANNSEVKSIINLNFMMREVNEGDRVILSDVQFDGKLTELTKDAKKSLDELAVMLKDNSNILTQLEIHTDAQGDADANLKLSRDRATVITDYLVSKGISKDDFYVKGYGERKIVNHCGDGIDCAEVQHRQNRRVVFWLRAQIGENELFNQPLTTILKNEGNATFSAPTEAPRMSKAIVSVKGDDVVAKPTKDIAAAKPVQQMDKTNESNKNDEVVMSNFSEEQLDNAQVASADIVFPRQRNKSEDDNFGSSFVGQVDVKPEEVVKICDVDGIKPNSKQVKKDDINDKGIPSTRLSKDEVKIEGEMSVQTEVTYDNGDAIVRRSGRAILVNEVYTGYKVELFTSQDELDNNHKIFKRYGKIFLDDTGTSFSYMIGSFQYKDAAEKFLNSVIKPTFPEAKVIRYKEGKRK